HAAGEELLPVEVAGLEFGSGLVGAVVEDDRPADAVAAIAVYRREIRPANAIVVEPLVEGRDAGLADAGLHEFADAVADPGGGDAGAQAEAIGEVRRDVVLPAGDVDVEATRLAKRRGAGIEAVNERPEGEEIEGARIRANGKRHERLRVRGAMGVRYARPFDG